MKLVFIGTLHNGGTPHDELIDIIKSHHPSHLLVEIAQENIEKGTIDTYPDEMRAALRWAWDNGIPANGIDAAIDMTKAGLAKEEKVEIEKRLNDEQIAIIKQYDWKDFNTDEYDTVLRIPAWYEIIDTQKEDERNLAMAQNIRKHAHPDETSVIITGSGHINFFKKVFPDALFPLNHVSGN